MCFTSLIFVTHCIARTTFRLDDWFVGKFGVAIIEFLAMLMTKSLYVDGVGQQIVKGEHISLRVLLDGFHRILWLVMA